MCLVEVEGKYLLQTNPEFTAISYDIFPFLKSYVEFSSPARDYPFKI